MLLSLILGAVGAVLVVVAAWMVSTPLGLAVAALWVIGAAVMALPDRRRG